jgi:hypothetical protein
MAPALACVARIENAFAWSVMLNFENSVSPTRATSSSDALVAVAVLAYAAMFWRAMSMRPERSTKACIAAVTSV